MSSVHPLWYKCFVLFCFVLPSGIKNPSRALCILSLSELISSNGMSSVLDGMIWKGEMV